MPSGASRAIVRGNPQTRVRAPSRGRRPARAADERVSPTRVADALARACVLSSAYAFQIFKIKTPRGNKITVKFEFVRVNRSRIQGGNLGHGLTPVTVAVLITYLATYTKLL